MNDYKNIVNNALSNISQEIDYIKDIYDRSFHFDDIFSTENGGKTKLNRAFFNENNLLIKENIKHVNFYIDEVLSKISSLIAQIVYEYEDFKRVDIEEFIYEDVVFVDLLDKTLNKIVKSKDERNKIISNIKELNHYKNKFLNYKHLSSLFNIDDFENYINKLSIEELINSALIYKILDTYALQYNELLKLKHTINSTISIEKFNNLESFNSFLELYKRKLDSFMFLDVRYIIALDYNINVKLEKAASINSVLLENIIANLIIQSCNDLIKKELKKAKFNKLIEVNITNNRSEIVIVIKNNGFEDANIAKLSTWTKDNKYILYVKNMVNIMGIKFDINVIDNEGMKYTLILKLK